MTIVTYNGFQASVDYDDGAFFVRVLHVDDLLIARVEVSTEVEIALKNLIDEYVEDCRELGREPQKPFSGTFNVRIEKELHRRAAMAATEQEVSLNAWVEDAISQKVECDQFSERVNGVLHDVQTEVRLLHIASARQNHWHEAPLNRPQIVPIVPMERIVSAARFFSFDEHVEEWGRH